MGRSPKANPPRNQCPEHTCSSMASRKLCRHWLAEDWDTSRTSAMNPWREVVSRGQQCMKGLVMFVTAAARHLEGLLIVKDIRDRQVCIKKLLGYLLKALWAPTQSPTPAPPLLFHHQQCDWFCLSCPLWPSCHNTTLGWDTIAWLLMVLVTCILENPSMNSFSCWLLINQALQRVD